MICNSQRSRACWRGAVPNYANPDMSMKSSPDRYRGSARYYSRGRLPYPAGVVDALALARAPGPRSRLLDVGCGPGLLTCALAQHYDEVVGVDVDADMLTLAVETARERELTAVSFQHLRAERIDDRLGTFDTVTFALSFHWMDQPRVAQAVRSVLRRGGVCVHVFANTLRGAPVGAGDPGPPYAAIDALRDRYLGEGWRDHTGRADPAATAHAMRNAGFEGPEVIPVAGGEEVTSTVEDLVARCFSTASSGPARFTGQTEAFEHDLRALLSEASPGGTFAERLFDARLDVWRPRSWP